ncbi:MAG: helix-turn-helix transcriptional regulator [Crocinitomicaceae bacterium]|nr:helix-turn-helix transcriptional regulator [Crocinitomicaceae bacterium]
MKLFTLSKQPADIKMELTARMKALRKKRGYSQMELAERSNVSLGSIKRFEQQGEISLHHLLEIAQILDSLEDFDQLFQPKEDEISEKVRKAFE